MKRLWILMMVLAAVLVLGACASSRPQPGDTSTEPGAAAPVSAESGATGSATTGTMGTGTPETTEAASAAQGGPCASVRCAGCPEGQTPALHPEDCCRCVPLDEDTKDCLNVRCAACPEGQHPALVPPDCCRCVPD